MRRELVQEKNLSPRRAFRYYLLIVHWWALCPHDPIISQVAASAWDQTSEKQSQSQTVPSSVVEVCKCFFPILRDCPQICNVDISKPLFGSPLHIWGKLPFSVPCLHTLACQLFEFHWLLSLTGWKTSFTTWNLPCKSLPNSFSIPQIKCMMESSTSQSRARVKLSKDLRSVYTAFLPLQVLKPGWGPGMGLCCLHQGGSLQVWPSARANFLHSHPYKRNIWESCWLTCPLLLCRTPCIQSCFPPHRFIFLAHSKMTTCSMVFHLGFSIESCHLQDTWVLWRGMRC